MGVENVSNGVGCPFELAVVRDGEEAEVEEFRSSRVEKLKRKRTQDPPFQTKGRAPGLRTPRRATIYPPE
jgi:hypothetical protein